MEVASPLSSFVPSAGTKRSLSCSPVGMSRMEDDSSVYEMAGGPSSGSVGTEATASGAPAAVVATTAPGLAASFAALAAVAANSEARFGGGLPPSKRRRYLDASVDSLSESFSSHSPFVNSSAQKKKKQPAAASTASPPPHQRPLSSGATSPASLAASTTAAAGAVTSPPGASLTNKTASSWSRSTPSSSALDLERQRKHDALQAQIDEQAALIASLRSDKTSMEAELAAAKLQSERSQKENALLRRAVNIQQEKHVTLESQLRDTQQQKSQADEKVRVLEQMVVTLRYHLQASSSSSGPLNDFMGGMPPRPPDVY